MLAAQRPIEVVVHSSPSTLTFILTGIVALLGSIVVAGAAVFAARLAARTANQRQREQLTADFARFTERLTHERDLANRDHTRDVIDKTVERVDVALRCMSTLSVTVTFDEEERNEMRATIAQEEGDDAEREEVAEEFVGAIREMTEQSAAVFDAEQDLIAQRVRLKLRLGMHPIIEGLTQLEKVYEERHDALRSAVGAPLSDKALEIISRTEQDLGVAVSVFMAPCEAWFAEQVPADDHWGQ